jgi:hypothetical protein
MKELTLQTLTNNEATGTTTATATATATATGTANLGFYEETLIS